MGSISDRYDMDRVHDHILQEARERERGPRVDMARLASIASSAYRGAKSAGHGMEEAERRAMAALDASEQDSAVMLRRATRDLGEESPRARKREFAFEFIFAAVLPFLAAVMAVIAMQHSVLAARVVFLGVAAVLAVGTVYAMTRVASGTRVRRFSGFGAVLAHSGGSVAAGLCTLLAFGYFAYLDRERDVRSETVARLEKLNQAAAVTLAAREVGANIQLTQAAVRRATEANWITVQSAPASEGPVVARAELPRMGFAELRLVASGEGTTRLASFVQTRADGTERYADYIAGKVVAADLKEMTLAVGPQQRIEKITLHPGTLPPSVDSEVVVAVRPGTTEAIFVQSIDSVVTSLRKAP